MKDFSLGRLLIAASVVFISACSTYAPAPSLIGQSVEQVRAQLGPPTSQAADRLVYARGPYGRHTWFLTLDGAGKVQAIDQRLREDVFAQIVPEMPQARVLDLLGPPSEQQKLARERGMIWSWRYENHQCLWFQVEMTEAHQVRSAGYGQPPECNAPDWSF